MQNNQAINILWTGGMDSTFRLAQLLFIYKKNVQPYYIIDEERFSTQYELRAMEAIKKRCIQKDPENEKRILPTIFHDLKNIPADKEISDSYQRLVKIESIGIQYQWLARFCKFMQITDMELSLETAIFDKDNRTRKLLGEHLKEIESDTGKTFRLSESAKGLDKFAIYGYFTFPAYDFTKADKYEYSVKYKFDDVIRLTWFCHMPTKWGKPCGKCHPCRAAYREGLKWRLPFSAKIRYHTWPFLRKITKAVNIYDALKQ